VQAALTVLGRLHPCRQGGPTVVDLYEANLAGARLERADLAEANFHGADLRGAYLAKAVLNNAKLRGAQLQEAEFPGAKLGGADLTDAQLHGVDLTGAEGLEDVQIASARGDPKTKLPGGIERPKAWDDPRRETRGCPPK
jgi:uncharacterized protein YjbI with pentapeptide repeats